MRSWIIKSVVGVLAVAVILALALVRPDRSKAIATPNALPPLHAGIGSPGSVILEGEQHENPEFFAIVKTDWPLLGIEEPRTAWEFTQRGAYYQDDLEDEDAALEDYLHAEELLVEIAERLDDITLPERHLQLHFRLGPLFLKRGEYESAIEHFEILLFEDPELEGINREIAVAFEHLGEEAFEHGDLDEAQEYFQEAYNHFEEEFHNAPTSQLNLYEFGLFLEDPHVGELFEVDIVDFEAIPRLDEAGNPVPVDKVARAIDLYQRYLDRVVEHCDTYPIRIMEVDKKVRALGGPGNDLALRNCIDRERIQ